MVLPNQPEDTGPLLIRRLSVRLAVEYHLLPRLETLENVQHVLELRVVRLAWAHESAIFEAVVFELPLILICHT